MFTIMVRVVLGLLLTSPLLAHAADWPRFRGPDGLGTADDKNIPVAFTAKDYLWKTPIPGKGNSSPIVSNGKVFLQTASEDGAKRMLVCVDAVTGKIDWSKETKGGLAKTHAKNSLASSTPAADGKHVYAVFWNGRTISLTAWDFSGKELWAKDLGGFVSQHGPGLSPIIFEDKVILNVDQDRLAEVIAFDAKTGDTVWKKSRPAFNASYSTPFVWNRDGKAAIAVGTTAGVTAYDPTDGTVVWNWTWEWRPAAKGKGGKGGPLRNVGGPILHNGMIFVSTGDGGGDRDMVALKADGSGDVTETALAWEKKKGTAYVPMVLGRGDYVFWISDKENKGVCANAKTGEIMWEERLSGSGEVTASPVMIDGKIYSISESGRVTVFAAEPKYKLLAENDLKESVYASPAVANDRLYIRGTKTLFCIGKQ
jgi:outer membrane protein assembly factor BamB